MWWHVMAWAAQDLPMESASPAGGLSIVGGAASRGGAGCHHRYWRGRRSAVTDAFPSLWLALRVKVIARMASGIDLREATVQARYVARSWEQMNNLRLGYERLVGNFL